MHKILFSKVMLILSALILMISSQLNAQKIVLDENFNTSQGTSFTTNGVIGTSIWNVSRSGNDFGAKIDGGLLTLTNDATPANNTNGWILASTTTSSLAPNYKSTLNQNVGIVSWSFNMRKNQAGTNTFANGNNDYGIAYILAGTAGSSNSVGSGYAVRFGYGGTETIRLVRYGVVNGAGLNSWNTLLSSSNVGTANVSIRVEYNPQTNRWALYTRQDTNAAFEDPTTGSLTLREQEPNPHPGSITGATNLVMTGAFWNAGNAPNRTAIFDNISITAVVPEIISLTPSSRTAGFGQFALTVNGINFQTGDQIYWNGTLRNTTFISATQLSAQIPATDIATAGTANITVRRGTTFTTNAVPFTIQAPQTPILVLPNTILNNMQTTQGTPSVSQNYTISANNLTADATVTAPANFQISLSNSGPWSNTLSLAKQAGDAGGLDGMPVTIYARLTGATAGVFSGNISHVSAGALTKNVAVSGRVMATEPVTSASNILFSNISSTSFKVDWTIGIGANRLLIVKKASVVNSLPTDGITYFDGATFGSGSDLGDGNFVVYKGNSNSVTVLGLEPSVNYHVSVIEFNGPAGAENYLSVHVPANTTTLNNPVGLQLFAPNTSYKINFDQTVDGVNADRFEGSGINPNPTVGELDSDAWAFTGFASDDLLFGGTSPDNSSYEMGISTGSVNDTGIYGFNVSTSNVENLTLGIQPGGTDFNPGNITLKVQNQTGVPMTSVNIGYKVYIYNDQNNSSKISFGYSANGTDFTDVSGLEVISPTTSDLNPAWKAYYRVVTIPTGTIEANSYYYIRWTGSNVSGTGAEDEFAIDDIEVIANPTSNNYVSFQGLAEDFVLQGNANLSADLSVQNRIVFNGGKLAIKNNTLTVAGLVTNTTSNGLTGGATSKLIVRGTKNPTLSFDQTTLGTTNSFDSLSLLGSNPNLVTVSNAFIVNELLKIDEVQTLELGTTPLLGSLNSIQNNGTIVTQNTSSTPFPANKIWNGTGVLKMNATSTVQTLVAGTYTNLTLSSTAGTTAATNVTVNGILHLPSANANATTGSLNMTGVSELTMGNNGTNTGVGEVTGIIKRVDFSDNKLLTFGHPNSSITFPTGGILPTILRLKVVIGTAPTWRPGGLKRYYDVSQVGGNATKAIIRQHFLQDELNGNIPERLVNWVHLTTPISPQPADMELGRSSLNLVENWVEITNANFGIFFGPDLGQAYIILDESDAQVLVWNGIYSSDWENTANWFPNGLPSSVTKNIITDLSAITPARFIAELKPTSNVGSLIIELGGIVNSPANAVLTVHQGGGAWQNAGTFNPGTGSSKVIFNNIDATISGSTTFNNLTVAENAGIRPLDGNYMSVAGTLTNNGIMFTTLIPNTIEFSGTNQIIPNVKGLEFGGYHNLKITGSGAAFETGYQNINVRGNLTLDNLLDFTGRTVNLVGDSNQTLAGTAAFNFDNLIVNKPTGVTLLQQDIAVGGSLTITSGNIVLGSKNLTLGSNPVLGSFGTNKMIVADGSGVVRRAFSSTGAYFFPIGELTSSPSYSPINVNVTAGSFSSNAYVGVNVVDAIHPNNKSSQNYISRYWNVKQTGITDAVANITAEYVTAENLFPQESMAAGQLDGSFNVATNPWKKVGTLSGTTLLAEGVMLTDNQASVFTGIKGGNFSVEVFGYGEFCIGSAVTLVAVTEGGDAPFTYIWSNSLNSNSISVPTETVGSTTYDLTVRDANGFAAIANNVLVDILPETVGGTITNNAQQICAGSTPADLVLSGSVGDVLYWQKSIVADFATFENLSVFTGTITGSEIGPLAVTTYFRAALKSADCDEVFSAAAIITIKSTIWNGTTLGWSNGEPDSLTSAIFAADFTATNNLVACSILVKDNAMVIIPAALDVTINGAITIESGSFKLESNTNLIQLTDAQNTGNIIVERESANLFRFDYTMWGSPLTGNQTLKQFSPATVSTRFFNYNSSTDLFNAISEETQFQQGRGYLIRMANNHILFGESVAPLPWTGTFTGVPNNGTINVPLDGGLNGFNLISNPYASMINADTFLTVNKDEIKGTLYFWRRRNNIPLLSEGTTAYYATYTVAGGTGVASSSTNLNGTFVSAVPNGFIQVGQGFIAQKAATPITGNVSFTNSMRTNTNNANQFFRNANTEERSRIWLNVTNATGQFGQTLVAYMPQAENGVDRSDGKYIGDGSTALTSWLDNSEYIIQGRAPFENSDVVALNFKTATGGNYTVAIDHVDGLFLGSQDIFLRDNLNGVLHDLKASAYTFATEAGSFNTRFDIVYLNPLSVQNPVFDSNSVILYQKENTIVVNSGIATLDHVEVFDIRGRLLAVATKINSNEVSINVGETNQVLIVKITSTDGLKVTKKTMN